MRVSIVTDHVPAYKERLAPMMGWVDTVPMGAVRAIGTVEILGAAGLLLPPLTGTAPALAILAALGFLVLQILAAWLATAW
ncbi:MULTISPECIES: DoxX family protein [unclassified Streptomyces]|uniref:DoxX family protein n=1 Tax=unclassified Streptomyces TaxID=2593676 RepID=UPI003657ADB1